jgi:catechol 2,3-dioxygenase-like lactoylglutathione lyase family enzyme
VPTLKRLAHYSIRAANLDASVKFYCDVLGLEVGPRPPFGFAGAWLYLFGEGAAEQGTIHLIDAGSGAALDAYLGDRQSAHGNTGPIDHIAFFASGWEGFNQILQHVGVPFTERVVPLLGVRQVFMTDPDGVVIELNFAETT